MSENYKEIDVIAFSIGKPRYLSLPLLRRIRADCRLGDIFRFATRCVIRSMQFHASRVSKQKGRQGTRGLPVVICIEKALFLLVVTYYFLLNTFHVKGRLIETHLF